MAYDRKGPGQGGKGGGSKWYEQKSKKPGERSGSGGDWTRATGRDKARFRDAEGDRRPAGARPPRPLDPAWPGRRPRRDTPDAQATPERPYGKPAPGRFYEKPAPGRSYERPAPQRSHERPAPGRSYEKPAPQRSYERPAPVRPHNRPAPPRPGYAEEQTWERDLPRENMLVGRNPIREALKAGRDMEKLLVARGDLSGSARELIAMAKERRIVVQEVDRVRLDALSPGHQGMVAFASAFRYATVEDMLALAKERDEPPFLVILDGITDPHNLGAIIRSAECAGAHGVIVAERRAVGLTPAAVKASAGAVEYLPVARVGNISRVIEQLKEQGIWIYAAVTDGERYDKCDLSGPVALVIGAEGEGLSRLALEKCDHRVALPLRGQIGSLNASVAAGVLLYEVLRRRL